MKSLLIFFFVGFASISNAQYFNIFPVICDSTTNNEFHYEIEGIEAFSDSVILHVELLTNDEQLNLITDRIYVFSDTVAANFPDLTRNLQDHTFAIDLGNHSSNGYLLHMWVIIAGEIFDEIYYQQ